MNWTRSTISILYTLSCIYGYSIQRIKVVSIWRANSGRQCVVNNVVMHMLMPTAVQYNRYPTHAQL